MLPDIAKYFQSLGINALVYDPRTTGSSGGSPRNETDPSKQSDDYSEAFTFLIDQPSVDPEKVGFWGYSFSGLVALVAAALDKRAKFVIAIAPWWGPGLHKVHRAMRIAIQDRKNRLEGKDPVYHLSVSDTLLDISEKAAQESIEFLKMNEIRSNVDFPMRMVTAESYGKVAKWQPHVLLKSIDPTPAFIIVPEEDRVSKSEQQIQIYNEITAPKRLRVKKGAGHFNVLSQKKDDVARGMQSEFIRDCLEGRMKPIHANL